MPVVVGVAQEGAHVGDVVLQGVAAYLAAAQLDVLLDGGARQRAEGLSGRQAATQEVGDHLGMVPARGEAQAPDIDQEAGIGALERLVRITRGGDVQASARLQEPRVQAVRRAESEAARARRALDAERGGQHVGVVGRKGRRRRQAPEHVIHAPQVLLDLEGSVALGGHPDRQRLELGSVGRIADDAAGLAGKVGGHVALQR